MQGGGPSARSGVRCEESGTSTGDRESVFGTEAYAGVSKSCKAADRRRELRTNFSLRFSSVSSIADRSRVRR